MNGSAAVITGIDGYKYIITTNNSNNTINSYLSFYFNNIAIISYKQSTWNVETLTIWYSMIINRALSEVIRDNNGYEYFIIVGYMQYIDEYLVVNIVYMDDDYKWRYRHF